LPDEKLLKLTFLFYVLIACGQKADGTQLEKFNDRTPQTKKYEIEVPVQQTNPPSGEFSLPKIAMLTVARKFPNINDNRPIESLTAFSSHFSVPARFQKRAGIFVTLSKRGKTRVCWGTIEPLYANLVEGTIKTTSLALANEYRYSPLKASEIKELKPQVTVVEKVVPISNLHGLNPLLDGLMVRLGTKTGVILPGEASDPYYQLMLCKVKARIAPGKSCQLYRIIADVYK
jgi:AMMECR1 domain-containing protein